jgi:hypothetical protein
MNKIAYCCLLAFATLLSPSPGYAQNPEDSLAIYAATITKTVPFREPIVGYAIYLGRGEVISAAHVVGRWQFLTRPKVQIAGIELSTTVLKMGSADGDGIDIALLKIDESKLPVSLRLRLNPICTTAPVVGEEVFAVVPNRVVPTHIFSPEFVPEEYRRQYNTLLPSVVTTSGSGIFRGRSKCLLGIQSKSVPKFKYTRQANSVVVESDGVAGYFVPATQIRDFLGIKTGAPEPSFQPGERALGAR